MLGRRDRLPSPNKVVAITSNRLAAICVFSAWTMPPRTCEHRAEFESVPSVSSCILLTPRRVGPRYLPPAEPARVGAGDLDQRRHRRIHPWRRRPRHRHPSAPAACKPPLPRHRPPGEPGASTGGHLPGLPTLCHRRQPRSPFPRRPDQLADCLHTSDPWRKSWARHSDTLRRTEMRCGHPQPCRLRSESAVPQTMLLLIFHPLAVDSIKRRYRRQPVDELTRGDAFPKLGHLEPHNCC